MQRGTMKTERKKALILLNASAGTGRAGLNTWTIIKKFAENGYESIVYPLLPGTDLVYDINSTRQRQRSSGRAVVSGE